MFIEKGVRKIRGEIEIITDHEGLQSMGSRERILPSGGTFKNDESSCL